MDKKFLLEAINLAENSVAENLGGPFGAVVAKDGGIIGRGYNCVTSTNDPTAHAEIVAIRDACRNTGSFALDGAEIYSSCEPCPMCLAAIYWARIKSVYYASPGNAAARAGFDDSYIAAQIKLENKYRDLEIEQVHLKGSEAPFDLWIAKKDKIQY